MTATRKVESSTSENLGSDWWNEEAPKPMTHDQREPLVKELEYKETSHKAFTNYNWVQIIDITFFIPSENTAGRRQNLNFGEVLWEGRTLSVRPTLVVSNMAPKSLTLLPPRSRVRVPSPRIWTQWLLDQVYTDMTLSQYPMEVFGGNWQLLFSVSWDIHFWNPATMLWGSPSIPVEKPTWRTTNGQHS